MSVSHGECSTLPHFFFLINEEKAVICICMVHIYDVGEFATINGGESYSKIYDK